MSKILPISNIFDIYLDFFICIQSDINIKQDYNKKKKPSHETKRIDFTKMLN